MASPSAISGQMTIELYSRSYFTYLTTHTMSVLESGITFIEMSLPPRGSQTWGYTLPAMLKQIESMKKGGLGSEIWKSVREVPLSKARISFAVHKEAIEDAAQTLRIQLKLRLAPRVEKRHLLQRSAAMKNTEPENVISQSTQHMATAQVADWTSSSDEDEEDRDSPCVQRKKTIKPDGRSQKTLNATLLRFFRFEPEAQAAAGKARGASANNRQQIDDHFNTGRPQDRPRLVFRDPSDPESPRQPTLLFRAFLPGHGFRARKFLANNKVAPPPPPMASETFLEKVEPHLRDYLPKNATYLSPYIS